jgi:hypothetical protein
MQGCGANPGRTSSRGKPGPPLPVEISFEEFAANHWETYVTQNLKPSTQASHRSNVRTHLLPAFGKLRLSEISALQIMELFKEKSAAGLKPKSLLNQYVLLQKMLNLAVALELLNSNPIQRVPKPKVERAGEAFAFPGSGQGHSGEYASEFEGAGCPSLLDRVADRRGLGSEMVGCGLRSLEALRPPFSMAQKRANPQE